LYYFKFFREKIKWICKILRFYAHFAGYSLVFNRSFDEKTNNSTSSIIKSTVSDLFSEIKANTVKDHLQPLNIEFGKDSLEEIGDPKVSGKGNSSLEALWEQTFFSTCGEKIDKEKAKDKFDTKKMMSKYIEKTLDSELNNFE
jgi:hypothetical protein